MPAAPTGRRDDVLKIAEIVHKADLADGRYDAPQAPRLDIVLRGLSMVVADDQRVLDPTDPIFDGLYEYHRQALLTTYAVRHARPGAGRCRRPSMAALMPSKTWPSTPSGLSSVLRRYGGIAPSIAALRTRAEPYLPR
jgi:hypothetical protein